MPNGRNRLTPSSSLAEAYAILRPLLLAALGALARQGCVAPPDEGLDLIHDFILEDWPTLVERFEPGKARLETYAYAVFLRSARSKIVRLTRLRDGLMAPIDLAQIASWQDAAEPPSQEYNSDLVRIAEVVAMLPDRERRLLSAYVSDGRHSERDLAAEFSLSRYQVRLYLADALGAIAAKLGEAAMFTPKQRRVLNALWREQRTVKETARALRVPAEEINAMRTHFSRLLTFATDASEGRPAARAGSPLDAARTALAALLRGATDQDAIAAVRAHADRLIEFLETPQGEAFLREHLHQDNVDVIAVLYTALGEPLELDPADQAMLDGLLQASDEEAYEIGDAFSDTLMPNLRDNLKCFRQRVFLGAPQIDRGYYAHLLEDLSVVHGGPHARELALFGVTPKTVAVGAQSLANLGQRVCQQTGVKLLGSIIVDRNGKTGGGLANLPVLPRAMGIEEVRSVCELPVETSERLFDWLCDVSEYTPKLFDGFYTDLSGDELRMQWTRESTANLFERWAGPPPRAIAA